MKFLLFVIRVYYEKIGHILKPLVPNFRPDLSARLTRASVVVSATFAMVEGGGGGKMATPLQTQKLRGTERRGKSVRLLSVSTFESIPSFFSLRSILRSPNVKFGGVSYYFFGNVPLSQNLL